MKLPSLSSLVSNAFDTFKRFPFAIIAAIIGCVFSILNLHLPYSTEQSYHWYWNVMMSCYLGMLLLIALTILSERKTHSKAIQFLLQAFGAAVAIAYYFSLPNTFMAVSSIRFILFSLGLHWLIAFMPFTKPGHMNAFWQYNKAIFLRILTSFLYTTVLYIGLALALLAVEKLFSVHVNSKLYGDLWIVLACVFNTWFFLAGFPANYSALEQSTDYPKGLKIFTQYVLLPIITIYLLILYAYMFKIIIHREWPIGWVSYLVLAFSVVGILSLLLIHPIRHEENNKWILTFSRFFYLAIYPILILLFFAIERRISDYGITELRYFVLVLALWLLFIATYFLMSSQKNIKVIPQSLALLALLTSFGYWGAFSVSIHSQQCHFEAIMNKNKLLVNEKLKKAGQELPFKDEKEISSITEYLVNTHGYQTLQPYYTQNLDSVMKHDSLDRERYGNGRVRKLLSLYNLKYINQYEREDEVASNEFNYITEHNYTENDNEDKMLKVEGFDYLIDGYNTGRMDETRVAATSTFHFNKDSVVVKFSQKTNLLTVSVNNDSATTFSLDSIINKIATSPKAINQHSTAIPQSDMTFLAENKAYKVQISIMDINGNRKNNHLQINNLRVASILIAKN
ncbi:DUF4153 domain-containing protein [Parasediminibacterium sp. JCM 36343]|uniref:DUF4153 domain-containing protein n=1 Tax=Parasediminibacterium sp. JCM 36343 TaxID=3374279 RepID=UPI00397CB4F9